MVTAQAPKKPLVMFQGPLNPPVTNSRWETRDPAGNIPGMPPNYGNELMPHAQTFAGLATALGYVYRPSDDAMLDDPAAARAMRRDLTIMECVEARTRATALLDWHIEPEDKKNNTQKAIADQIRLLCNNIPRFMQYRENLLQAIWYGKAGVSMKWGKRMVRRKMATLPVAATPIHGDKIVYRYHNKDRRYDETDIGIKVGLGFQENDRLGQFRIEKLTGPDRIQPTEYGLAYFIPKALRPLVAIHKHFIEDGEFDDINSAGRINGVGIRSRIYSTWLQKQLTLAWMMEYIQRSAQGFEVWYYQWGNPESEAAVRAAAQQRDGSNNVILCPYIPDDTAKPPYDRIEPGMGGVEMMKSIVMEYFGHLIKRYIMGQTLTSEQGSGSGMNSNLADIHLATFLQIVKYDALNLEETLTEELIKPIVALNFPEWTSYSWKFRIDTESDNVKEKLEAMERAWKMGLKIKTESLYDTIGEAKPGPTDEVLSSQQDPNAGGPQHGGPSGHPAGNAIAAGMVTDMLNHLRGGSKPTSVAVNAKPASMMKPNEGEQPAQYAAVDRPEDSDRIKIRDYTAEVREHYDLQSGERWITLNGGNGDGTHIKIDGAGRITGGPDALAGKRIGAIDQDREKKNMQPQPGGNRLQPPSMPRPATQHAPLPAPQQSAMPGLRSKFQAALGERPAAEHEQWRKIINGAMQKLPQKLHEKFAAAANEVKLMSRDDLGNMLRERGVAFRSQRGPNGAADVSKGGLYLDGLDHENGEEGAIGVTLHEISHLFDKENGANWAHSKSPEWQAAFAGEINVKGSDGQPRLSAYAMTHAREGWAEFGRLAWSNPQQAQSQFPKCWAVFASRGLV